MDVILFVFTLQVAPQQPVRPIDIAVTEIQIFLGRT
jgi:hypothetical protein